ncbi:ABC transporter ATP-binding protein [Clostridium manihotivorum]|uniref:ABC transporter ATP-binding protein n=1 Tax=Clostridium manihotivorum TaxID=2320868 RepID=A0A3R5QSN4_9CLOT|nr:ABC transporter ATP-binding protein [Clostridium manihotivorum]QAA31586.1 ABC transporter ATP-binding protein [Clostridium manihotivorum]
MEDNLIFNFIKENKLTYFVGVVFMFLTSYIQSLFPNILGNTIDILKKDNFDSSSVKLNIVYLLLVAIATFITTYLWRNFVIVNARKLECSLRERLFDHFQTLSPDFYNNRKTGDLIAYAINDISAVRMTFGPAIAMSINGVAICIISIYSMARSINWEITLISLLPIPIIILFMMKIGTLIQKRFKIVQESFGAISDRVQENIYGIRVIKAYVQEEHELDNFEKLNQNMKDANINMIKVSSFLSPAIEICFSISFVINLIYGGNAVLKGSISLGSFIAFNGYLTMIMNPILSIGRVITIFQRGMASLKRLNDIFSQQPEVIDGKKRMAKDIKGNIKITSLDFSYKGSYEKVLQDINLDIPLGTTLGIVGETGSGKSTLVNLLLKLYNVKESSILLDGKDINEYTLSSLRKNFGYVPQDNFLFSASIKDNIKFFKEQFSNEQVEEAAKNSCIYDSIINLPNGFETILGERGVNLSGGQKQRIAIARALVKDPSILILDDSLSAVDTITEGDIIENLKEVRKGKTTIIIAHRVSAVEMADKIIVMSSGRIVEFGNHKELMNKRGRYYEIYMEQYNQKKQGLEVS